MSYDGIIMQRAIARFDQARQRREAELDQRRREGFARQPSIRSGGNGFLPASPACGTLTEPSAPP